MICRNGMEMSALINFLSTLYDDEMLYSVLARYQRMCGMISNRAMIKDMFGELIVIRSTFFHKHLNSFVINLPTNSKPTDEEIINNHTMLSFYTAILSEEKANNLSTNMAEGRGRPIETTLGLGVNKVRANNYLRYCPCCFKEDLEKLGESYWRRAHQIVGGHYCLKHKCLLKNSSVLSTSTGLDYIVADEDVCNEEVIPDQNPSSIKKLNLKYVSNAEYLMKNNYDRKELPFIISFYIDRLRESGLASKNGFLYMNDVEKGFIDYYSNDYLEMMQSEVDTELKNNWLRLFVRNNKGNRSPLRHLLYLQYLDVSPKELFNTKEVVGRISNTKVHTPKFDIHKRREKWIQLIKENKGDNREELKEKGKGLHTWIFRYDREWYEKVTPRVKYRKPRSDNIDWKRKDEECLKLAKEAVQTILNKPGKPIRVTPASITRTVGEGDWFRKNKNLVKTLEFMETAKEDIDDFRIRKIRWAIEEMLKNDESLTPYKVQLYAGFGGGNTKVRELIEKKLEDY